MGVKRKTWVDFKSQKMKKTIESNDAFDMHKIYAWVHKVDIHSRLSGELLYMIFAIIRTYFIRI